MPPFPSLLPPNTRSGYFDKEAPKQVKNLFPILTKSAFSMSMRKWARTSLDSAVVNVWKREVGEISTRNFAHSLGASEDLVLRFDVFRKLKKHRGWVNTVSFSADGDIIVSGSNDRKVILWDWETGKTVLPFHSGHDDYVFQAKIMPHTNDRSIVTCAADGQVRQHKFLNVDMWQPSC